MLIVAEVALTMVLLVGAGVAIRGFFALTETRLGFDPANILTAQMNMSADSYKTWGARSQHFLRMLEKLQSTPGVLSAAATITAMPPRIGFQAPFEIPGHAKVANQDTQIGLIGGDYFGTLRIAVLRGRTFSQSELARSQRVGVINDEMLLKYWPASDPIGAKVYIPMLNFKGDPDVLTPPSAAEPIEIVGVVATARNRGLLDKPRPAIYVPWTLVMPPSTAFLVRTQGDPHNIANAIREQVRAVDPDQPLTRVQTLEELMSRFETAYPRFSTTLFSIFAGVALLLAASGLYSVVSYVVARRTHEFGIRMALGANAADVLRLVMWMTARLMIAGIGIGLGCSLALSRVIANYISGWDPKDPVAFIAVTITLFGTALLASWLPARRSVAIQPMVALRHE